MKNGQTVSRVAGLSLRQAALVAGLAYLLNPVTFAELYAMPRLEVSGDAVQTVANLTAHPHLFAAALLSYLGSALGDVILGWSLYALLAPVNRAIALLGSLFQWIYAAAWLAAIADLGALYRLVAIPQYATQVDAAALASQALLLLAGFHAGWGLSLVLFGLHLVVIGVLIARSSYVPRWIGWLLGLVGLAWIVNSLAIYLYPQADLGFLNAVFGGELVFMVWLLGWGWRVREPVAVGSSHSIGNATRASASPTSRGAT